jgi:hypothetical protein
MKVTIFKPCPMKPGQKIRIQDSPLQGDWEIIRVSDFKITLRCPLSGKELVKDRFLMACDQRDQEWPLKD